MPCDTKLRRGQTLTQRKVEVKRAIEAIATKLSSGAVQAKLSPKGAIAFVGVDDVTRAGVTDACVYRMIMSFGSASARAAIARAEALAGRRVSETQIAIGAHSHDGGATWHDHKG